MSNQHFLTWLKEAMYRYGEEHVGSGYDYRWSHLARDVGLRTATISAWKKNGKLPDAESISKLAVHFGTTSREIYKAIGVPPSAKQKSDVTSSPPQSVTVWPIETGGSTPRK